jgi:lipoprotein-anchoring transpeptidase ErfK/SrfK
MAVLAAAGTIGAASQAEAALFYWPDSDPGFSQPAPAVPQRRPKPRHRQGKSIEAPQKEATKPQGPLIIAISIEKQNLKIYDANGLFAETPISSGMRGHSTPMGVFSVIQKQKLHHSNIYSGAPMPYMQRITWSGIAIHAGVLPGYPASHGCIRMPMAFAVRMWNWTKMGARVVVTPGEMIPAGFSHPLLVTNKVVPQPIAANEPQPDTRAAAKADKAADADVTARPAIAEASGEPRSTVGHFDGVKPVMGEASATTPLREQTHTADAGALPTTNVPLTMSDAAPSGGDASNPEVKPEAAKSEAEPATAKHDEVAGSDDKPVENKSLEVAIIEDKSAETDASKAARASDEPVFAAQPSSSDAAAVDTSASESNDPDATEAEAKVDHVKAVPPKPDAPKSSEKPDESTKAVTDASPSVPDVNKDPTRLSDPEKSAASKPDPLTTAPLRRAGQIAVFISRKDSKLYVRQNFAPLFEAPVTIAPSDRPLGTHVFTAQVDKTDANVLHWSVVSLPVPVRHAERRDDDERMSRRRKITGAAEIPAMALPDSPSEALDRITIPADAMARITQALSTGSSIIVSDQGIAAGETGEGTDFIISLR